MDDRWIRAYMDVLVNSCIDWLDRWWIEGCIKIVECTGGWIDGNMLELDT